MCKYRIFNSFNKEFCIPAGKNYRQRIDFRKQPGDIPLDFEGNAVHHALPDRLDGRTPQKRLVLTGFTQGKRRRIIVQGPEAHLYAGRNITAPENPVGRNLIDGNGRPEIHDQQIAARVERRSADGSRKTVLTQSFGRSLTVTNGKRKLR